MHLTLLAVLILLLGGFEIWYATKDHSEKSLNLGQMSALIRLGDNPSPSQLIQWDIPLEPKEGQPQTHIHVALRIFWNGAAWPAPAGLGVNNEGQRLALHTHDSDAVVHIHRPRGHQPFTLEQILNVWGLPIRSGTLNKQEIHVWKNGKLWLDWQNGQLNDKDDIVIQIGPAQGKVPLNKFDWSQIPLRNSR